MGTTAQKLQAILDSKADIASAIEEKGGTVPTKLSDYGDAIRNLPTGGTVQPDVEFIDYDGRTLYSYTFAEASALEEMPGLPTRTGFINEGWNYDLPELTGAAVAGKRVIVGCTYITDDDITRIHITLPADDLTFYFAFGQTESSSVEINWGDGTTNVVGMSAQTTRAHEYTTSGDKVISITPLKSYATLKFDGNIGGSGAVQNNQKITDIELGKIAAIGNYAFSCCDKINAISIPKNTTINNYCLDSMVDLKSFVVPNTVTSIPQNMFEYCSRLTKVSIPATTTTIGNSAFYGCSSLTDIGLVNVTTIGESCFERCTDLIRIQAKGVTLFPTRCFYSCGVLKTLDVGAITGIMGNSFYGCGDIESVGTATITEFGSGTANFAYCDDLTEIGILEIPAASSNNYKPTIGTDCFRECKSLRTLVVRPDDTTTALQISANAFLKAGITTYDFSRCTQVPVVASNAFSQSASDKVIKIPLSGESSWKNADVWKNFPIAANVNPYRDNISYSVGDFCVQDHIYYRCKTACNAGPWNTNKSKFETVSGFLLTVSV